jgi:hypothetical protein
MAWGTRRAGPTGPRLKTAPMIPIGYVHPMGNRAARSRSDVG